MSENYDFLNNAFDGLKKGDVKRFKEICFDIAQTLFKKYCIECVSDDKKKVYYFAEIEFYYFKNDIWNDTITYERDEYSAGTFFYHLSGVDICFDSKPDEYGGILIRSIFEIDSNKKKIVTTGPLNCLTIILNSCKNGKMPKLIEVSEQLQPKIESTYRYLGDDDQKKIKQKSGDNKDGDNKLAFFDSSIQKEEWDSVKKKDGSKKYYYTHRFVYE